MPGKSALLRHLSYDIRAKIAKEPRSPTLLMIYVHLFNRRLGDLGSLAILARIPSAHAQTTKIFMERSFL
jgi:hypothetical protein